MQQAPLRAPERWEWFHGEHRRHADVDALQPLRSGVATSRDRPSARSRHRSQWPTRSAYVHRCGSPFISSNSLASKPPAPLVRGSALWDVGAETPTRWCGRSLCVSIEVPLSPAVVITQRFPDVGQRRTVRTIAVRVAGSVHNPLPCCFATPASASQRGLISWQLLSIDPRPVHSQVDC